jgi:hypothetical protein
MKYCRMPLVQHDLDMLTTTIYQKKIGRKSVMSLKEKMFHLVNQLFLSQPLERQLLHCQAKDSDED